MITKIKTQKFMVSLDEPSKVKMKSITPLIQKSICLLLIHSFSSSPFHHFHIHFIIRNSLFDPPLAYSLFTELKL